MSKKLYLLLFLLFTLSSQLLAKSQTVELGSEQNFALSSITSLQFSTTSNSILKQNFLTNPNLTLEFTSFFGSPVRITAVADLVSLNSSIEVNRAGTFNLSFSNANPNANTYGLSVLPLFAPAVFTLKATSTMTAPPTPTGTPTPTGASPIPTPSGGVTPTPTPKIGTGGSTVKISGTNSLKLKQKGANFVKLSITFDRFKSTTQCQIYTSNDNLVRVKPRTFSLGKDNLKQTVTVGIPREFVRNLIETNTSKDVLINVTCENGASDEINLSINLN